MAESVTNAPEQIDETIGPYNVASRIIITAEALNAMSPEKNRIIRESIQSTALHYRALEASYLDATINNDLNVRLNGQTLAFGAIIALGERLSDKEKIELVRKVVNENITYTPPEIDPFVPRRAGAQYEDMGDYAQTTRETFESGIGDCEDWAIAQADMLLRMGMAPPHLQIMSGTVYGAKDNSQFDHVNLAVKTSDGWDVMELNNRGKLFIAPKSYLTEGIEGYYFFPVSSIDGDGVGHQFKITPDAPASQGFTSAAPTAIKQDQCLTDCFGNAADNTGGAKTTTPENAVQRQLSDQTPSLLPASRP